MRPGTQNRYRRRPCAVAGAEGCTRGTQNRYRARKTGDKTKAATVGSRVTLSRRLVRCTARAFCATDELVEANARIRDQSRQHGDMIE